MEEQGKIVMPAIAGVVLLLLLPSILAAEVDSGVWDMLQTTGEASVMVMMKDQPIAFSIAETAAATPGSTFKDRKEMIHAVQQEVLGTLRLKPVQEKSESISIQAYLSRNYDLELIRTFSSVNGFSGQIKPAGIEKLRNNPNVERIVINKILHPALDFSIPQVNANDAWNLSVGGYNISGHLETVCVIDTGIDTDHPAFQNKILAEHCFCNVAGTPCCAGSKSEALTAEDDQGHGTHVAGIAAGNDSTYTGIARDARIVALKVCNNASSASCTSADIISAIDWCTNNATTYNISVISMSIGDSTQNNAYCNSDSLAPSINTAAGKNISVVISAGNSGYTAGISAPACIQNATPVGAVNDNDAIQYNRGAILEILAPGVSITGPGKGGGTTTQSGTSMSAPQAAGAVTLFRQYWRLAYSRTPTVDEIKRKLMITGTLIDDSSNSGKNYSRVDILAALQPFMNFTDTSAANNSIINANNSFINITSDVNLTNSLLEWNYNNGSIVNITLTKVNGTHFYLNATRLLDGVDTYRVYGNDTVGTLGTSAIRTITIDTVVPAVAISNPANGSNFSSGTQAFNATVTDANINTVLFQFNNASGNDFNVTPANVSGNWNANLDLARLAEGRHSITVFANDSARNLNNTQLVEFTVDRTPPAVTFNAPANERNFTRQSGNHTFNATAIDATLTVETVLFSFDNASGTGFNLTARNQSGYWSASYNVSTLAEGAHMVIVFANDTKGNLNSSETVTFTVDNTPPAVTLNSPASGSTYSLGASNQTFNATVRDTSLSIHTVLFSFDNASGTGFNITAVNQSGYWVASYNISLLADGTNFVHLFSNDSAGNLNNTEQLNFTVDISTPVVTLNKPITFFNSSSSSITFNCSASENTELANLTLYGNWSGGWHANETTAVNGTSNETIFTKTLFDKNYRWSCQAADTQGNSAYASANFTLTVDTVAPNISAVSSGTPTATAATITWSTNEQANSTVNYGTTLALGTGSSSTSRTTSHSRSLSSLSASTTYHYNVTSCDYAGNCNTTGDYNLTTTASSSSGSSDSSSSSAGGGGGGSGGAGTTANAAAEENADVAEEESIQTAAAAEESDAEESVEEPAAPAAEHTLVREITLLKNKVTQVEFEDPSSPLSLLELHSRVEQNLTLEVKAFTEKPEAVAELPSVYRYLEIVLEPEPEDLKSARIVFRVDPVWLTENNFTGQQITLRRFEESVWSSSSAGLSGAAVADLAKKAWKVMETELVDDNTEELQYTATVPGFSYFAIAAEEESPGIWSRWRGWLENALSMGESRWKVQALAGIITLILLLLVLYLRLKKQEDAYR